MCPSHSGIVVGVPYQAIRTSGENTYSLRVLFQSPVGDYFHFHTVNEAKVALRDVFRFNPLSGITCIPA